MSAPLPWNSVEEVEQKMKLNPDRKCGHTKDSYLSSTLFVEALMNKQLWLRLCNDCFPKQLEY